MNSRANLSKSLTVFSSEDCFDQFNRPISEALVNNIRSSRKIMSFLKENYENEIRKKQTRFDDIVYMCGRKFTMHNVNIEPKTSTVNLYKKETIKKFHDTFTDENIRMVTDGNYLEFICKEENMNLETDRILDYTVKDKIDLSEITCQIQGKFKVIVCEGNKGNRSKTYEYSRDTWLNWEGAIEISREELFKSLIRWERQESKSTIYIDIVGKRDYCLFYKSKLYILRGDTKTNVIDFNNFLVFDNFIQFCEFGNEFMNIQWKDKTTLSPYWENSNLLLISDYGRTSFIYIKDTFTSIDHDLNSELSNLFKDTYRNILSFISPCCSSVEREGKGWDNSSCNRKICFVDGLPHLSDDINSFEPSFMCPLYSFSKDEEKVEKKLRIEEAKITVNAKTNVIIPDIKSLSNLLNINYDKKDYPKLNIESGKTTTYDIFWNNPENYENLSQKHMYKINLEHSKKHSMINNDYEMLPSNSLLKPIQDSLDLNDDQSIKNINNYLNSNNTGLILADLENKKQFIEMQPRTNYETTIFITSTYDVYHNSKIDLNQLASEIRSKKTVIVEYFEDNNEISNQGLLHFNRLAPQANNPEEAVTIQTFVQVCKGADRVTFCNSAISFYAIAHFGKIVYKFNMRNINFEIDKHTNCFYFDTFCDFYTFAKNKMNMHWTKLNPEISKPYWVSKNILKVPQTERIPLYFCIKDKMVQSIDREAISKIETVLNSDCLEKILSFISPCLSKVKRPYGWDNSSIGRSFSHRMLPHVENDIKLSTTPAFEFPLFSPEVCSEISGFEVSVCKKAILAPTMSCNKFNSINKTKLRRRDIEFIRGIEKILDPHFYCPSYAKIKNKDLIDRIIDKEKELGEETVKEIKDKKVAAENFKNDCQKLLGDETIVLDSKGNKLEITDNIIRNSLHLRNEIHHPDRSRITIHDLKETKEARLRILGCTKQLKYNSIVIVNCNSFSVRKILSEGYKKENDLFDSELKSLKGIEDDIQFNSDGGVNVLSEYMKKVESKELFYMKIVELNSSFISINSLVSTIIFSIINKKINTQTKIEINNKLYSLRTLTPRKNIRNFRKVIDFDEQDCDKDYISRLARLKIVNEVAVTNNLYYLKENKTIKNKRILDIRKKLRLFAPKKQDRRSRIMINKNRIKENNSIKREIKHMDDKYKKHFKKIMTNRKREIYLIKKEVKSFLKKKEKEKREKENVKCLGMRYYRKKLRTIIPNLLEHSLQFQNKPSYLDKWNIEVEAVDIFATQENGDY